MFDIFPQYKTLKNLLQRKLKMPSLSHLYRNYKK